MTTQNEISLYIDNKRNMAINEKFQTDLAWITKNLKPQMN